ncbi:MAG: hypothetical protein A2048_10910 [Deltaproteobacteria bacterium GWA2_45_12]|nr:MAG: hypothetical protein A2048_10910 [Deltaproteobacteria bacterium GWA2_45_12]
MNHDIPQIPTPPRPEQEPRFPSLEEIKTQLARFMIHPEIIGSERISGDHRNPRSYEVATMDDSGKVALYAYVADTSTGSATVYVSFWKGDPSHHQWLGGTSLSSYKQATQTWSDTSSAFDANLSQAHKGASPYGEKQLELPKPPDDAPQAEKQKYFARIFDQANVRSTQALIDMARHEKTPREDLLEMIYSSFAAIAKPHLQVEFTELARQYLELPKPDGVIISIDSIKFNRESRKEGRPKEEIIKELSRLFDTAEKILGTMDVQELEASEHSSLEQALTRRALAKPFADRTTEELLALNQSYEPYPSLKSWNPAGRLEEYEFNALNRRRNILMNAIGSWNINSGGIRHDLNKI